MGKVRAGRDTPLTPF